MTGVACMQRTWSWRAPRFAKAACLFWTAIDISASKLVTCFRSSSASLTSCSKWAWSEDSLLLFCVTFCWKKIRKWFGVVMEFTILSVDRIYNDGVSGNFPKGPTSCSRQCKYECTKNLLSNLLQSCPNGILNSIHNLVNKSKFLGFYNGHFEWNEEKRPAGQKESIKKTQGGRIEYLSQFLFHPFVIFS